MAAARSSLQLPCARPAPAADGGYARSRCHQCGGAETASSADGSESFCASCGLVLSEGTLVAGPDAAGGVFLCADAATTLARTARGRVSDEDRKNLMTLSEIRRISSGLGLTHRRDRIKFLWECVVAKRPASTPRGPVAIAACAYVVALEEELSVTMRQVAKLLGTTVWRFAAVYKHVREILKECRITGSFAGAAELLDKCVQDCGTLPDGISLDDQDVHRRLLSDRALSVLNFADEAGEVEGYHPGGCAAGAVVVAISSLARDVSDGDLCYPAGRAMLVSAVTVARRAAAFRRVLERAAVARAGPRAPLWEANRRRGNLEAVSLLLDGNYEELRKPLTPPEVRMLGRGSDLETGGVADAGGESGGCSGDDEPRPGRRRRRSVDPQARPAAPPGNCSRPDGRPVAADAANDDADGRGLASAGAAAGDAGRRRVARCTEREFEKKTGGRLRNVRPGKCVNPRHVWFGPKDGKYHHHNRLDLEECYTACRPEAPDDT